MSVNTFSKKSLKPVGVVLIFAFLVFAGFGCKQKVATYKFDLNIWGVFDNESDYKDVELAYKAAYPFARTVSYRKFTIDTYKKDLLNALAAGKGPDIFMIHNSWLPEFYDKIEPAPPEVLPAAAIRTTMADALARDMIVEDRVYGVTPSVDSLALYYNEDIFNAAGITSPPKTWQEFDDVVKALTRISPDDGRIILSGAAMGTATNINRPMDILTALMMQGGAQMISDGEIAFDRTISAGRSSVNPARDALLYYTSFARGTSDVYTWNKQQDYSIDAFIEGDAAMMISYGYVYDGVKAKNEKLNFKVAPLPQIDVSTPGRQSNFANYWVYVVAKNRALPEQDNAQVFQVTNDMKVLESWQFLKAFIMKGDGDGVAMINAVDGTPSRVIFPKDLSEIYISKTRKPPARKDLIEQLKDDERFGPFVRGNLIARTWTRPNSNAIDQVFFDMIDEVNRGKGIDDALELGAQRSRELIK